MTPTSRSSALVLALLLVACAGDSEGIGGSGGAGGATSSSSTSAAGGGGATGGGGEGGAFEIPTGDCVTSADCGGAPCLELVPGGFDVCDATPQEVTECIGPKGDDDECCDSSECAGATCYASGDLPYCGGAMPIPRNRCIGDECGADLDCAGGATDAICAPAGAFGQPGRACVQAYCRTNADCTDEPNGYCAPILNPCCNSVLGLACVYPSGCRRDSDCANGHCDLDTATGRGVCKTGGPACPP